MKFEQGIPSNNSLLKNNVFTLPIQYKNTEYFQTVSMLTFFKKVTFCSLMSHETFIKINTVFYTVTSCNKTYAKITMFGPHFTLGARTITTYGDSNWDIVLRAFGEYLGL